jgi:hypothetical protein
MGSGKEGANLVFALVAARLAQRDRDGLSLRKHEIGTPSAVRILAL